MAVEVLFAGGGTGGHIYPNIAIAERLAQNRPDVKARFLVSDRIGDARILDQDGWEYSVLPIRPLPPLGRPWRLPRFAISWRRSLRRVSEFIDTAPTAAMVATGGFVSVPAIVAAGRAGVPVALVNLDAVPGIANTYLARYADQVFSSYRTRRLPAAEVIGVPLRRAALAPVDRHRARQRLGLDPDLPVLFITGATHGGRSLVDAVMMLLAEHDAQRLLEGWQVFHQCGSYEEDVLQSAYAAAGVSAKVVAYCPRMGEAWGSADLAIGRAGAGTVAEAWANAVPTIFVPNPHHRVQRRGLNVEPMVDTGGAVNVEDRLDPRTTAGELRMLLADLIGEAHRRSRMREALERTRPRSGAELVAAWVVEQMADRT